MTPEFLDARYIEGAGAGGEGGRGFNKETSLISRNSSESACGFLAARGGTLYRAFMGWFIDRPRLRPRAHVPISF